MGEAKRRGTRQERVAQAKTWEAARERDREERRRRIRENLTKYYTQ